MRIKIHIATHRPLGAKKDADGERIKDPTWDQRSKNPLPFKIKLGAPAPRNGKLVEKPPPMLPPMNDSRSSFDVDIFDGIGGDDSKASGSGKDNGNQIKHTEPEWKAPNLGPTKHLGTFVRHRPPTQQYSRTSSVNSEPIPARYRVAAMPTDAETLGKIKCNAVLAAFPYDRQPDSLPEGWATSTQLSDAIAVAAGIVQADNAQNAFGTIVDARSGLVASVLVNEVQREVVISFGGTSAGPEIREGEPLQRGLANLWPMSRQWLTNVGAGFGREEASYRQARELVGKAVEITCAQGFTVRTVGHSKGGGEAMYSALAQTPPLNADVFSPSHLSSGLISRLPEVNVNSASKGVRAYSVSNDVVPKLRHLLPGGAAGVGRDHFFPPDPNKGHGMTLYSEHVWFTEHLDGYIENALREKSQKGSSEGSYTSDYKTASEGGGSQRSGE